MPGAKRQLVATQALTASAATYYTAPTTPSNAMTIIRSLVLANTSSTNARTATVHIVASGGTASASNQIVPAIALPVNSMVVLDSFDGLVYLPAGSTLQALASAANDVTITVSGEEVS